jgi:hypothetical protein
MRRVAAQCAALVATAIVAVATLLPAPTPSAAEVGRTWGEVTTPRSEASGQHRAPDRSAAPQAKDPPDGRDRVVRGTASTYLGTAGYVGVPSVALPGPLGGRHTGSVEGHVTICADRCARLPVVDWCDCYWGSAEQRVVDLSHAAWPLVTDRPLSAGLVHVRVILREPVLTASLTGRRDG